MPKYMIRHNHNGRPLIMSLRELAKDEDAIRIASDEQDRLNAGFKAMRDKGLKPQAVAVVEVLKLIYQGEPFRVDPERIRKRREKAKLAMSKERQDIESWIERAREVDNA